MSQTHPTDVRLRRARDTQGGGRGAGQAGPLAPRMPSPPSGKGVADPGRPISPKKGRPWGKGSWPFTSNGASGPWLTAVAPGAQHPEVSESHLAREKFRTEHGHVPKTAPFRVALSALGMLCPLQRLSGPPGILTLTGLGGERDHGCYLYSEPHVPVHQDHPGLCLPSWCDHAWPFSSLSRVSQFG